MCNSNSESVLGAFGEPSNRQNDDHSDHNANLVGSCKNAEMRSLCVEDTMARLACFSPTK